jgi:ATP/ADP translocase
MSIARVVEISMYVSGFVLMAAIVYTRPLGNVFDYVLGFGVFFVEVAVGVYVGRLLRASEAAAARAAKPDERR